MAQGSRADRGQPGGLTELMTMTVTTTATTAPRRSLPHTIGWIGLVVLAAFNLFAVASDLAADAGTGLPSDHSGTFAKLAGPAGPRSKPAIRAQRGMSRCWNAAMRCTS
jgi:hypothetical protein